MLEHPPKDLEIAIVQAEHSDRWVPDDVQRLKALAGRESKPDVGKVSLHVLPNSGHWVHVDNPKGLLEIMVPNFLSAVQNWVVPSIRTFIYCDILSLTTHGITFPLSYCCPTRILCFFSEEIVHPSVNNREKSIHNPMFSFCRLLDVVKKRDHCLILHFSYPE